jgi:hypothetical protein
MTAPRLAPPLRIRTEADVLALVPFTLGFHPEDSLVLITLTGSGRPFHARIDLPDEPGELKAVVEVLTRAAVRNGGPGPHRVALVVVYSDDECVAEAASGLLSESLEDTGFEVVMTIRADGSRWFPLGPGARDNGAVDGTAYDVRSHELTTRAVVEGQVTFRTREELADSLAPVDPDSVDDVASAYATLGPLDPDDRVAMREEADWLTGEVRSLAATGAVPTPQALARVLRAVGDRDLRDLAWCEVTRDDAAEHAEVWRAVVQRCPSDLVAAPAALLAFMAWLSGNGALAWCAVDRSLQCNPDNVLAGLVAQALESAMPPTAWRPIDRDVLTLTRGE